MGRVRSVLYQSRGKWQTDGNTLAPGVAVRAPSMGDAPAADKGHSARRRGADHTKGSGCDREGLKYTIEDQTEIRRWS